MSSVDDEEEEQHLDFYDMGLDDRLLKSIALLGWTQPTLIQEKAIPLALDGNDILARARTGSGKTAVFAIPVIHKILEHKKKNANESGTRALVLAPSKELCQQLKQHIQQLTSCCLREVRCVDVASGEVEEIRPLINNINPEIVVGTPSKILAHLQANSFVNLKNTLQSLVVDEADLLFSFGFKQDMESIVERVVPWKGCQSYLVSATLNPDVINLKNLVLNRPVIIKLEEPELPHCDQLAQYHISCLEDDKFVLLIALIKLNLLRGRTIIFVSALKRCYKLKLFLEQFAVKSCLLNPELPIASRCNVVDQFNKGVYNLIIACDERCVHDPTARRKGKTAKSKIVDKKEFVVSRGIDFQSVSNVINFDFPTTVTAYVHRVGRTARAINAVNSNITEGTVLSFVAHNEQKFFNKVKNAFGDAANFKPYAFKMEELEAFKYRSKDAIRAVTKDVIRAARVKEIKFELRNSQRLKSILKKNPNDVDLLRHDRSIKQVSTQAHLKDVPDYIVPPTLKSRQKQISVFEKRRLNHEAELSAPSSRRSTKKSANSKASSHRKSEPATGSKKKRVKKTKGKRPVDPLKAARSMNRRKGGGNKRKRAK